MLIVYQDWKCMWPGAIGPHRSTHFLRAPAQRGIGREPVLLRWGLRGRHQTAFSLGIALGEVAICGYWAYLLHRQTLASAEQNMGLRALSEQLHRSEGKFRALIAHALDIITVLQPDGTISYKSPSMESTLGYKPEEMNWPVRLRFRPSR